MKTRYFFRLAFCLVLIAVSGFSVLAQEKSAKIDLSLAGVKLGDRVSAKAFLENYSPGFAEDARPVFMFYNKTGTEVLKFVSKSGEDLYFITEMEIFTVGKSYQKTHYITEKLDSFETENGMFLDMRQSASSLIFGVPNRIDIKDLLKQKGDPKERLKKGKRDVFNYETVGLEIQGEASKFNYFASYEFYKNTLKKISLKIAESK